MHSIGVYEAKTHLAELVDRASKGQRITITRRGVPVAMICPPEKAPQESASEAIDKFLAYRKKNKLRLGMSIREAIEEGRR